MRIVAIAAIALAVAGCGSKGGGAYEPKPVKEPEKANVTGLGPKNTMPMAKGNQWVYDVAVRGVTKQGQVFTTDRTVAWKIVDVKQDGDTTIATLEFRDGNKVLDRQTWSANSKGVFQQTMGGTTTRLTFNPPMPAILFPADKGRAFNWKGKVPEPFGKVSEGTNRSEILAVATVDTGQEPQSAVPVKTVTSYAGGGRAESTSYFVPGIGMARYISIYVSKQGRMETKMVLKSFKAAG